MVYGWDNIWPKLLAFAVFLFLIYTNYTNYEEHRALIEEAESNPAEERVHRKLVVLDFFREPRFTVQVGSMPDSSIPTRHNSSIIGVEREVYEQLDVGDYLAGYKAEGKFYTDSTLKEEKNWFYILFAFFNLYPIGFVLYWLFKIKALREFVERIGKILYLKSIGSLIAYFVFWGITLLLIAFFATEFKNSVEKSYEKFFGKHHVETTALVVEKDVDWRGGKYDRRQYYVSLMYGPENSPDSLFVVKEVTRHTYDKYTKEMQIVYNEDNPYQVFASHMGPWDVIYVMTRGTVIAFAATGILVVLLCLLPYLLWKRNKAGHS